MKPATISRFRIGPLILSILFLMAADADAVDIQLQHGKLSVKADKAPLQNLLQGLAPYGIVARVDPEINPPITASFVDKELEDGLRSLLKSLNFILIWKREDGASGDMPGAHHRLVEILVFNPGEKGRMVALEPSGRRPPTSPQEKQEEESDEEPESESDD